jgi:hypothetical protein
MSRREPGDIGAGGDENRIGLAGDAGQNRDRWRSPYEPSLIVSRVEVCGP